MLTKIKKFSLELDKKNIISITKDFRIINSFCEHDTGGHYIIIIHIILYSDNETWENTKLYERIFDVKDANCEEIHDITFLETINNNYLNICRNNGYTELVIDKGWTFETLKNITKKYPENKNTLIKKITQNSISNNNIMNEIADSIDRRILLDSMLSPSTTTFLQYISRQIHQLSDRKKYVSIEDTWIQK